TLQAGHPVVVQLAGSVDGQLDLAALGLGECDGEVDVPVREDADQDGGGPRALADPDRAGEEVGRFHMTPPVAIVEMAGRSPAAPACLTESGPEMTGLSGNQGSSASSVSSGISSSSRSRTIGSRPRARQARK